MLHPLILLLLLQSWGGNFNETCLSNTWMCVNVLESKEHNSASDEKNPLYVNTMNEIRKKTYMIVILTSKLILNYKNDH